MTIETKFKEGDEIFFIHNARVCCTVCRGFSVERRAEKEKPIMPADAVVYKTKIVYFGCQSPEETQVFIKVEEENAFGTKEALIQSL